HPRAQVEGVAEQRVQVAGDAGQGVDRARAELSGAQRSDARPLLHRLELDGRLEGQAAIGPAGERAVADEGTGHVRAVAALVVAGVVVVAVPVAPAAQATAGRIALDVLHPPGW